MPAQSEGSGMKTIIVALLLLFTVYTYADERIVRCVGDIDGDGVDDIAAFPPRTNGYGPIEVRNLTGGIVVEYWFPPPRFATPPRIVDVEVTPDLNGNSSPEFALLYAEYSVSQPTSVTNDLIDSLTGERINLITRYNAPGRGVDLELAEDMNGNGAPELVSLYSADSYPYFRPFVRIVDAITMETLGNLGRPAPYFKGLDLEVYPDIDGDGLQEYGVLSSKTEAGSDLLQLRPALGDLVTWELRLSGQWDVIEQEVVKDINNDGYPEVAILRTEVGANRVHVALFGVAPDKPKWGWIPLDSRFVPRKLMKIPDINGNGSDELVVIGVQYDQSFGTDVRAFIRDSKTLAFVNNLYFGKK